MCCSGQDCTGAVLGGTSESYLPLFQQMLSRWAGQVVSLHSYPHTVTGGWTKCVFAPDWECYSSFPSVSVRSGLLVICFTGSIEITSSGKGLKIIWNWRIPMFSNEEWDFKRILQEKRSPNTSGMLWRVGGWVPLALTGLGWSKNNLLGWLWASRRRRIAFFYLYFYSALYTFRKWKVHVF